AALRDHACQQEQPEAGIDLEAAPDVETLQIQVAVPQVLPEQHSGDEVAAKREEEVHANPPAPHPRRGASSLEGHYQKDGNRSKHVERADAVGRNGHNTPDDQVFPAVVRAKFLTALPWACWSTLEHIGRDWLVHLHNRQRVDAGDLAHVLHLGDLLSEEL